MKTLPLLSSLCSFARLGSSAFSVTALSLALAFGAGLVAKPAVAQQLPSLGEVDGFTVGDERRIGDQIARQLYRDPDYIDDPVLQEYVEGIWHSLMTAAQKNGALGDSLEEQFAWQVFLGKDRTINAFALPGGYFGLHLGLINAVDSKDELASVMAHELSHVTQRHISRVVAQNARQTPLVIASMILGAIAASQSPEGAQAVVAGGQALAIQNSLDFSRAMEQEADRIGFGLMVPAGFDPNGFVGMFNKLNQASSLNDRGAFPYLRTHPLSTQRLSDMQARLGQEGRNVPVRMTLEHSIIVARSRVLSLGKVDFLRTAMQAGSEVLANRTNATPAEQAGRLYAAAMAAGQLREADQARQFANALLPLTQGDASAHRLALLLNLELALASRDAQWGAQAMAQLGDHARLRPELFLRTQYAVDMPSSADTALVEGLTSQWQSWLTDHPRDAGAWQQLARLWTAKNQPLRAIRAEAEAQVARLDYEAAIDRFKAGQNMVRQMGGKADHVDASILQSRLGAVMQLQRERDAALKALK
ncbi:peptidase M48 [Lampropedia puyangensis]|uniref:Peptidase M48 n=1 Tax=Lampropedia puyangensis TaxID=1330072 RepID=A0A4S8F4R3_9BURK|nr:M48 family metalloprotease [Lampropedia puyangensis]THU01495.1 peptidase M48 [Lampropedia puyangensis]